MYIVNQTPAASDWGAARGEKWRAQLTGMEAMLAPVDPVLIQALYYGVDSRANRQSPLWGAENILTNLFGPTFLLTSSSKFMMSRLRLFVRAGLWVPVHCFLPKQISKDVLRVVEASP